ncbi:MAG: transporter substrate-binding domain-containing protein [Planctomycetota bacterium]|nr:transporter substrate-binding domain-containing protein [Planctomycetota bacterium]
MQVCTDAANSVARHCFFSTKAGFLAAAILFCGLNGVSGQESGRPLRIATKDATPFAMRDANGLWTGISIELWREVAAVLKMEEGTDYEFIEMKLPDIVRGREDKTVDVGVAAMTMTHNREKVMDFTHGYYNSGLGIAVSN